MAIQLIDTVTPDIGLKTVANKINANFEGAENAASKLVATDATGGTVPVRDSGGTFKVGTPTDPEHPVRKQELDNDPRVKWVSGDKIITVADSGADFTTVMGAVAEAMKWRSIDGSVIVETQSGYLVTEQLIFTDNDYSHINIKAQGGTTITVDHNSMSVTDFEGSGASGFILCARGKSPMFQTQFEFLTRPVSTVSGVMAVFNGEVYFGNNSGVKGAGNHGLSAGSGSSVAIGDNNDFSGAGGTGAHGTFGGSVTMGNNNDFSGAGGNGAHGNQGGSVTMGDNNDFSGAGIFGAHGNQGGSVTMGDNNYFSGVAANRYSFRVADNGFIRAGSGTIFTSGRERSQAAGTITTSGLIMG